MTSRGHNSALSRAVGRHGMSVRTTRRGFTLIELMVVIAIIAILAGLLTVAGFAFVRRAEEAATATTISKVDEAIIERVSAINRWHERWNSAEGRRRMEGVWAQRGWIARWTAQGVLPVQNDPQRDAKILILSHKQSMIEAFPVTQEELATCFWFWAQFETNGITEPITPPYNVPLSSAEQTNMASSLALLDKPEEVFLYALLNAPVFGGLPMIEDNFRSSEFMDSDGDGVLELTDGWDNPLRFYRWPTRFVNYDGDWGTVTAGEDLPRQTLMPGAPSQVDVLRRDPDDPVGIFQNAGLTQVFHDPVTWHAPLVVSAGPDEQLGLAPPEESITVTIGSVDYDRYGLARPLAVNPDGTIGDPSQDDYLFDNLTNHTIDGGL